MPIAVEKCFVLLEEEEEEKESPPLPTENQSSLFFALASRTRVSQLKKQSTPLEHGKLLG